MSNLDMSPAELISQRPEDGSAGPVVLPYRNVPLGGPRAMTVRRSLPQRARSLIGAWCFVDHYGPDDVSLTGGMAVPGHPHTGLQTPSWLFTGEVEHRDTTGTQALVRAGQLNLMTAGPGRRRSEGPGLPGQPVRADVAGADVFGSRRGGGDPGGRAFA